MRTTAKYAVIALVAGATTLSNVSASRPVSAAFPQESNYSKVGESCGAGKDLVVQALEILDPQSTPNQLEDANQLLKRASDLCSELGEAWYYRALVEAKLNRSAKALYAMSQARQFPSEALQQKLNPFLLATPAMRGFSLEASSSSVPSRPAVVKPGPVQHRWALVIGINHFGDPDIGSLNFATQDADAFSAQLKDPEIGRFSAENVHELTDAQATAKNIRTQLYRIGEQAEPNDLVVIYIATHGSPRDMDPVNGVNYLLTYDTELNIGGKFDASLLYGTALPMVTVTETVTSLIKSFRTLVVLDTCYSGGSITGVPPAAGPKNSAPSQQMLQQMTQGTGRIILAASRSDEPSLESASLGHGLFTYALLQALKSTKGNQPISELFASVSQNVAKLAAGVGGSQHPVMYRSSEDADFSLGANASAPLSPGQ
jgi:hypothetical protein